MYHDRTDIRRTDKIAYKGVERKDLHLSSARCLRQMTSNTIQTTRMTTMAAAIMAMIMMFSSPSFANNPPALEEIVTNGDINPYRARYDKSICLYKASVGQHAMDF